jgi:hypothetical protein
VAVRRFHAEPHEGERGLLTRHAAA